MSSTNYYKTKHIGLSGGWRTGDSGWGTPMNNNLLALDVLSPTVARIKGIINTPPTTNDVGDCYMVGSTPTDDFASHSNDIAIFNGLVFFYVTPKNYWRIIDETSGKNYIFQTDKWVEVIEDYNVYIGTCESDVAETAKIITTSTGNFQLASGKSLFVKFVNGNTATSFTVNVDNTGVKPIVWGTTTSFDPGTIPSDTYVQLFYDGTNYNLVSNARGEVGPVINHKWTGTALSFQKIDGTYETAVDLKGDKGDQGNLPGHEWDSTLLKIQNPDGTFDAGVDLKGEKGNIPKHVWTETTKLAFENLDGTFETPVQLKGEKGDIGLTPDHKWTGTSLSFQKQDGTYETAVDLIGHIGLTPSHTWTGTTLSFQNQDGTMDAGVNLKGTTGSKPGHTWTDTTKLAFENPDGTYETPVNLKGDQGIQGPIGLTPSHTWTGTTLSFQNQDGTMDAGVNLKGEKGNTGNGIYSQIITIPANPTLDSNNSFTVACSGATATNTVLIYPISSYMSAWTSAELYCSDQAKDLLTFTCTTAPTAEIKVNVVIVIEGYLGVTAVSTEIPANPTLTNNSFSITVEGVTAASMIFVGPTTAAITDWANSQLYCSGQDTNSLTFTCTTAPTTAIPISVVIIEPNAV